MNEIKISQGDEGQMTATFIETCAVDGLSVYECSHAYCEECGSTNDVCGFCLRCAEHEGECERKNDPEYVAPTVNVLPPLRGF